MAKEKIKVLIVEDSAVACMLLEHLLNGDPEIQVIGTAKNGLEALEFVTQKSPDVVLMDIHMPEMDGFEATRRIMETCPVPIVICSASSKLGEAVITFRLMEAGAVACVEKPVSPSHAAFASTVAQLRQTVKLMSEVKVVRRWPRRNAVKIPAPPIRRVPGKIAVVGIGASTGGPPVLQNILAALPKDFPAPILIVQHIAAGFLSSLAEWLNLTSGLTVHTAAHGMHPMAGHAYLAPDDFHMGVCADGTLVLKRDEPENGLRPSVAHLFRALAEVYASRSIGVLLTGMGKDGAAELKLMRDAGAVTIAQDRGSSVVHGMPGQAIAIGAAAHVLPADQIASALTMLVNQQSTL
jgi:two-component system chemotaxis response regulator CheB